MVMHRRGLLLGLLAAPVVIRTPGLLMPVKPVPEEAYRAGATKISPWLMDQIVSAHLMDPDGREITTFPVRLTGDTEYTFELRFGEPGQYVRITPPA